MDILVNRILYMSCQAGERALTSRDYKLLLSFCFCRSVSVVLLLSFCFCRSASVVLLLSFCFCRSASVVLLLSFCFCLSASVVLPLYYECMMTCVVNA